MIDEQRTIANALDAGARWTAKWLADLRDAHEGTDTEHLVRSAEKALRQIETAKLKVHQPSSLAKGRPDSVLVPRLEMKVAIGNAIWKIDADDFMGARVAMVQAQDILTAAAGESLEEAA